MNRFSILAVSFALLAPMAAAQQDVSFSGHVKDGKGVCYYCPGFDFVLDNTHTSLTSSTINLTPYVEQYVTGVGHWNGSTTAPQIDVTSIQIVVQPFSIGGNATIGHQIKFTTLGTPGDTAFILVAGNDGFANVPGYGVMFLATNSVLVLAQGTIGGTGSTEIKIDLPDDPSLVGLRVFGQAARVGPTSHSLTNSDLKVIG